MCSSDSKADSTSEEESELSSDNEEANAMSVQMSGSESTANEMLAHARRALSLNQFDVSFSWYCTAFDIYPSLKYSDPEVESEFSTVVNCFAKLLVDENRGEVALDCLKKAVSVYHDNSRILVELGKLLLDLDDCHVAFPYIWKARCIPIKSGDEEARDIQRECTELIRNRFFDQWHFRMLNDGRRNLLYKMAIQQVCQTRSQTDLDAGLVVDVGSGTGLLSAYCANAGFKHILACDKSPVMCAIARETLKKFASPKMKIEVVCEAAENIELKSSKFHQQKLDLFVTEIFDCAFFGEHAVPVLKTVFGNLVSGHTNQSRTTRIIPEKAVVYVLPVESDFLRDSLHSKLKSLNGLAIPPVYLGRQESASYESFSLSKTSSMTMLGDPVTLYEIDMNQLESLDCQSTLETPRSVDFVVTRKGRFDAFVVYFDLKLCDSISISTNPFEDDHCKCWSQAVFPSNLSNSSFAAGDTIPFSYFVSNSVDLSIRSIQFKTNMQEVTDIQWTDDTNSIVSLNSLEVYQPFLDEVSKAVKLTEPSNDSVLVFVEEVSLIPFYFLTTKKFKTVYVFLLSNEPARVKFIKQFYRVTEKRNSLRSEQLVVIGNLPDIRSCSSIKLVYSDLVSSSGLVSEVGLQLFRQSKSLFTSAVFIPESLNVYCQLLNSPELKSHSEIISDSCLFGVDLKSKLEMFGKATFQDVDLRLVEYQVLSGEPYNVAQFNLSDSDGSKFSIKYQIDRTLIGNHASCAVAISFGILFRDGLELKTHDNRGFFKTTGVFLPNSDDLQLDLKHVEINLELKNCLFDFDV